MDDLEVAHGSPILGNLHMFAAQSLRAKSPDPANRCSGAPDPSGLQHQSPAFLRGAK